ncbi:predicted protein [Naegleria gruberi]|uniref:Predicted protein n=1 Tax=Naegleria gruberi TaxID=5762 RepID=D2V715_NAEGR|nr:uncharacterized protein NAEGRDRAFT_64635 [Naegleria gruberi]EFC47180.1 predicted protein [Naegleria gruberi]|eukprot:XP_002679924.1 predicted protein [Naegleria gruberi strain NEG-M]
MLASTSTAFPQSSSFDGNNNEENSKQSFRKLRIEAPPIVQYEFDRRGGGSTSKQLPPLLANQPRTISNGDILSTPTNRRLSPVLKRSMSASPSTEMGLESPVLLISKPFESENDGFEPGEASEAELLERVGPEIRSPTPPRLKRGYSNRSLKEIPTELLPTIVSVSSPTSSNLSPSPLLEEVRRQQGDLSIPISPSSNSSLPPTPPSIKGRLSKQPSFTDPNARRMKSSGSSTGTFLTEVSLKSMDSFFIPSPPKQVHLLPDFLFSPQTENIENCRFPSDFNNPQFPRNRPLNPKYVLNKTLILYFPSLFSDYTNSEHRIQFNDLFLTEQNQSILIDSFWWFFLTVFSKDYLLRKAVQYYEYMIEKELEKRKEKNNFFLRKEQHKVYKEKGENWANQVYKKLLGELPAIENRISNNYAELVVKFITHRSYTIKTNIQLDLDDIFIEVISKSVFLAYGLNFPDCHEIFETEAFQARVARQFQLWCFGVCTINLPFLDTLWMFKMELKSPPYVRDEHSLSPKQRFKRAIQAVRVGYNESIVKTKEVREELEKALDNLEYNDYSPAYNLFEMFFEDESEFAAIRKQNKRLQIMEAFTSGATLKEEELNEIIECDDRDEELFIELQILKEKKEKNIFAKPLPSKDIKEIAAVREKAWYEMGEGTTKTLVTNIKQVKTLGTFKTYSHSKKSSPLVSQYLTLLRHNKATQRKQERFEKRMELRKNYMKE